jgi:hypothetical protein
VGSGLILLGIVGAWLAVLVPMALRRHDASNLGTVDKFHDAMRVLSRRDGRQERAAARVEADVEPAPAGRLAGARARLADRRADRTDRRPLTPAARRRRLLLGLLAVSFATLLGGLRGPLWLLAPHAVADLLLGGFLVHLRRTAIARAEREWRSSMQQRRTPRPRPAEVEIPLQPAAPVLRAPVHVAGIPDRMPARPLPLGAPAAAPAARYEEPPAARGAQGEAWSPVPVPTPTYLTAPTAPRRVVDLTRPGAYADGLADAERELGIVDEGPELDEILERRRAVNDW